MRTHLFQLAAVAAAALLPLRAEVKSASFAGPPHPAQFESFTPSRRGWAFARPQQLRIRSGDAVMLEVSPSEYIKRPVHLFDSGRRDALSFRIPAQQFAALASKPEIKLKAGNASVRLDERRMGVLREFVQSISPSLRK